MTPTIFSASATATPACRARASGFGRPSQRHPGLHRTVDHLLGKNGLSRQFHLVRDGGTVAALAVEDRYQYSLLLVIKHSLDRAFENNRVDR